MVTSREFGKMSDGRVVTAYTIEGGKGASATILDLGCVVQSVIVPDKEGNPVDVTTGYDGVSQYETNPFFYGALVGRCCNRIGDGKLTIDGVEYSVVQNDGTNNLHSGPDGYERRIWKTGEITDNSVTFLLNSPDGDQGYPGNMDISVKFTFTEKNELILDYKAKADKDTIANFTNHSYWNLNGVGEGLILDHALCLHADRFAPHNDKNISDGTFADTAGTELDFRQPKKIGSDIGADTFEIVSCKGYDHHFDVNGSGFREAAYAVGDKTGIRLTVSTDADGVQFYSGNFLDDTGCKAGKSYPQYSAFAIEAQFVPNAINEPAYITPLLKAGDEFTQKTVYAFDIAD